MVRKKMEGNEEQKRQKARDAKERGHLPSEEGATTGASKQHANMKGGSHRDRIEQKERGKQGVADERTEVESTTRHGRNDDREEDRDRS